MNWKNRASELRLENEALLNELQRVKAVKRAMYIEIETLKNERDKYKFDHLTDMMGRIDFEEQYQIFFNDFIKGETDFVLGLIDINNLHRINRVGGYEAGYSLIKLVSDELKVVYSDSLLYRIGGDEFAILCKKIDCLIFKDRVEQNNILNKNITFGIVSVQDMFKKENFDKKSLFKYVDKIVIQKKLDNNKGRRSND